MFGYQLVPAKFSHFQILTFTDWHHTDCFRNYDRGFCYDYVMMIVMIMLWLFVSGRRGGGDLSQNLSPDDVVGLEPRQPEKVQVAAGKTFVYKLTGKTFVKKVKW
jgi:hypothetical protein